MTNLSKACSGLTLIALAAVAACSKGASTTSTAPSPARPFTAAQVAEGDSIYHARGCRNCHGPDGSGAQNGPSLKGPKFLHVDGSYNAFVNLITTGVPADQIKDPSHKNPMGARGGRPTPLTDDQIKAVAAYVYTLSHAS